MRVRRISITVGATAAAAALTLAALAPAADAPAPAPIVRLAATVSPARLPLPNGTPLSLRLDTIFSSAPAGADFVLQSAAYRFGRGSRINAGLFPSCSAATLQRARGQLSACPSGSRIGSGFATGTAVAIGVTSRARIALFNGPGGRSLTMNVSVLNPALINRSLAVPLRRSSGRYTLELAATLPQEFKTILGGDIVVRRIAITTGATRLIDGVRRGYFEAWNCPRGGVPIHGDFTFDQGRSASADLIVPC